MSAQSRRWNANDRAVRHHRVNTLNWAELGGAGLLAVGRGVAPRALSGSPKAEGRKQGAPPLVSSLLAAVHSGSPVSPSFYPSCSGPGSLTRGTHRGLSAASWGFRVCSHVCFLPLLPSAPEPLPSTRTSVAGTPGGPFWLAVWGWEVSHEPLGVNRLFWGAP